jgi:hypothetical protein
VSSNKLTTLLTLHFVKPTECGREGPSGARKYLEKKFALPEEDAVQI